MNFACQRCCQPLTLHSTFAELNDNTISELTGNRLGLTSSSKTEHELNSNDFLIIGETRQNVSTNSISFKDSTDVVTAASNSSSSSSSTTTNTLTPAKTAPKSLEQLNYDLKVTSRLFDILSDQSDIEHPLCEECADFIIDKMDQRLKSLEDECKDYREYSDKYEKSISEQTNTTDVEELKSKLEQLKDDEQQLIKQLESIELEQQKVNDDIEKQRNELEKLNAEDLKYQCEYNQIKKQLYKYNDDLQSVDNQLRYSQAQLDKLRKTNVFTATFHIWHNGHFGTINGFRLGRLPTQPVDWLEINAAWGQAALLLHSLAKKLGLTFKRYRIVPYGNFSFIESLDDKSKELPLYCSGGIRFLWNTKFDQAMIAYLDCLKQFEDEVKKEDTLFCLPYQMSKENIYDKKAQYSIKTQASSEEEWTKALKYMLTNLKWLLAWVSARFPD